MTTVVAYRLANWDTPFWVNPNRRESRFATPGSIVQYWSLHPLTPWAEQLRSLNARTVDEAAEQLLRPWAAEFELADDVLTITFDNAAGYGIAPDALVDDNWTRCQLWASSLAVSEMIVPSSALPGTSNLVLFGPRLRSSYGMPPLDPAIDVPSDPVANLGGVLPDLLQHIRWQGEQHTGYEDWRDGRPEAAPPAVAVDRP